MKSVVGEGALRTDPEKVSSVANYAAPSTIKPLRRFSGMDQPAVLLLIN